MASVSVSSVLSIASGHRNASSQTKNMTQTTIRWQPVMGLVQTAHTLRV